MRQGYGGQRPKEAGLGSAETEPRSSPPAVPEKHCGAPKSVSKGGVDKSLLCTHSIFDFIVYICLHIFNIYKLN